LIEIKINPATPAFRLNLQASAGFFMPNQPLALMEYAQSAIEIGAIVVKMHQKNNFPTVITL
jgi:hypothetical protein